MKQYSIFIICACLTLVGCGNTVKEEIGYGEIKNNIYSNQYFKLKITFPEKWVVQNREALKAQANLGNELIAGKDKNLKAKLNAYAKQSLSLFTVFQFETGTPVSYNPNIVCAAEKMTHMPGVKRGKDYFFHLKKILESGQLKVEFPSDSYEKKISDVSFDSLDILIKIGDTTIKQTYFAARIKNYILLFAISYMEENEKEQLINIMKTIKFNK